LDQHLRKYRRIYTLTLKGTWGNPIAHLFQSELDLIFSNATKNGLTSIQFVSKELHDKVFSSGPHKMPSCCRVMKKNMDIEIGDRLVSDPTKLETSTLRIEYRLPR